MTQIEHILKQVLNIVSVERTTKEEKRKRGEDFNIFQVLGLESSEVRLHSAFLAELLNPKGSHGLGDKFLKSFLSLVVNHYRPLFKLDTTSAEVSVEYYIGQISDDYREGGRIDILICDKYKNTIIIENKIYACDQYLQLSRYNHYAHVTAHLSDEQYVILYLTLEGNNASVDSVGEFRFDYCPISYRNDILSWLDSCIGISALFPAIREIIHQYESNLKSILNIMSESATDNILEILTDKTNIESALTIISLGDDVKKRIRKSFILKLEDSLRPMLEQYDLIFDKRELEGMTILSPNYSSINVIRRGKPSPAFFLQVENGRVYYGLSVNADERNPEKKTIRQPLWQKPNETWPHGWSYLPGDLQYWHGNEALVDMANGHQIIDTIKEELKKAMDLGAFDDIDKLLCL